MRGLFYVIGGICVALGALWILQGTDILKGGLMGGHIVYAFLGLVTVGVGIVLLALGRRRRRAPL